MNEPKKKMSTWAKIGIGCGGLIVLIIIISAIAGSGNNKKSSTPAAPDKTATPQTQAATPTSAPQVLLDLSGNGTKQTQVFTAGGDWDLNWDYDCSNFGYQGNFIVSVYNKDGSVSFENTLVNQMGKSGADVQHYHKGGTFYLDINSMCSWHVNAKG